jgi:hypothetical protein
MERDWKEKQRGSSFGVFFFAALTAIMLANHAPSALALAGLAGLAILLGIAAIFCAVRIAVPVLRARLDLSSDGISTHRRPFLSGSAESGELLARLTKSQK